MDAFFCENESRYFEDTKIDFFVELGDVFQYNKEKACKNMECPLEQAGGSRVSKRAV